MKNSMIATAVVGLAASAQANILSTATGQAKVVSNCPGNVYLANVPCDTSIAPITTTLNSSNPTYAQDFSQIVGGCGWSIKLGSDPSLPANNILQYEYTWQGAGQPVWYDMSLVNQNGDAVFPWSFSSSDPSTCNPNNANYFTDATTTTGMQTTCNDDITLTLQLCGSGSGSASSSSSAPASAASSTSSAAATTTTTKASTSSTPTSSAPVSSAPASSAPASTPTTLATSTKHGWGGWTVKQENVAAASTVTTSAAVSTSAVTSTTAADGVVVTETDVFYVTEVATTYVQARDAAPTPAAHKRHIHGHPHGARA